MATLASRLFAALIGLAMTILPAAAQMEPVAGDAAAEREALFQRILQNPADLDANFRYAELSSRAGDLEAAIGALERMLFYNPDLPRVQAELGLLYFRLGSYEMARSYFGQVLASASAPAEVRQRVEGFLAAINRRLSPQQVTAIAQFGLRYQTNANAGPSSDIVRVLGQNATLNPTFAPRPDWSAFGMFQTNYVQDLENQNGDVFEISLLGYYSKQRDIGRLDLGIVELQAGPRFGILLDTLPGSSARIYGLANTAALGSDHYLNSYGAGLSYRLEWMGFAAIEPFVEVRRRTYFDSFDYPNADDLSGTLASVGIVGGGVLGHGVRWAVRALAEDNDTRFGYNDYQRIAVDVGLPIEFASPFGSGRPWSLSPFIGASRAVYDAPNLFIDPRRRHDNEYRVGLGLDAGITQTAGVALTVQYTTNDSNITNYSYDNFSVTFGPSFRF